MKPRPIVLAFLMALMGCQPHSEESPAKPSTSTAAESPEANVVRMHFWTHDPNSKLQTIEPVTEAAITEAFNKADWSGPKAKYSLVLAMSNDESISIDGVAHPENDDDTLRATWTGAKKDAEGRWIHYQAKPLDSPETGLKILLARFKNDGSIESLAQWTTD